MLGVSLTETTPDLREHLGADKDRGVLVSKVLSGMPAEDAGIEVGDLITQVDLGPNIPDDDFDLDDDALELDDEIENEAPEPLDGAALERENAFGQAGEVELTEAEADAAGAVTSTEGFFEDPGADLSKEESDAGA